MEGLFSHHHHSNYHSRQTFSWPTNEICGSCLAPDELHLQSHIQTNSIQYLLPDEPISCHEPVESNSSAKDQANELNNLAPDEPTIPRSAIYRKKTSYFGSRPTQHGSERDFSTYTPALRLLPASHSTRHKSAPLTIQLLQRALFSS